MTTNDEESLAMEIAQSIAGLNPAQAMAEVNRAISVAPDNARLYFLRGSLHAEARDYTSAVADFRRSTSLDDSFSIATFQLGLLLLCLGDRFEAQRAWHPLERLPESDCLRLFQRGLSMIDERPAEGIACLEAGQSSNTRYPPLNHDMQVIIDRARALRDVSILQGNEETHVLLSGYFGTTTKH